MQRYYGAYHDYPDVVAHIAGPPADSEIVVAIRGTRAFTGHSVIIWYDGICYWALCQPFDTGLFYDHAIRQTWAAHRARTSLPGTTDDAYTTAD